MLITGRLLLDPDPHQPPLPGVGYLRVEGDRIVEVAHGTPPHMPDLGDASCLICPAFTDAHVHLPQIDSIGCDGMNLLHWLERVIFPAESAWTDPTIAEQHMRVAITRMLRAGTFNCAGYLTSHPQNVEIAQRVHADLPIRARLGPVLMDRTAPGSLITNALPELPPDADRLSFTVTPRFAVSCSEALLAQAGRMVGADHWVQTHLAEQAAECELVRELFPGDPHYTAVYDRFGLLTVRTLLAHCLHLSDDEWALIAARGSTVVHCPGANMFLSSGLFDFNAAHRHGVPVALGSDVAGGPDLAMPRVARAMIEVAKLRRLTIDPEAHVPTPAEAWRMITHGNATTLGFDDAGTLTAGAPADLLLLRLPETMFDEHLLGRLLYTWRDDYIAHRILAGRVLEI